MVSFRQAHYFRVHINSMLLSQSFSPSSTSIKSLPLWASQGIPTPLRQANEISLIYQSKLSFCQWYFTNHNPKIASPACPQTKPKSTYGICPAAAARKQKLTSSPASMLGFSAFAWASIFEMDSTALYAFCPSSGPVNICVWSFSSWSSKLASQLVNQCPPFFCGPLASRGNYFSISSSTER